MTTIGTLGSRKSLPFMYKRHNGHQTTETKRKISDHKRITLEMIIGSLGLTSR